MQNSIPVEIWGEIFKRIHISKNYYKYIATLILISYTNKTTYMAFRLTFPPSVFWHTQLRPRSRNLKDMTYFIKDEGLILISKNHELNFRGQRQGSKRKCSRKKQPKRRIYVLRRTPPNSRPYFPYNTRVPKMYIN